MPPRKEKEKEKETEKEKEKEPRMGKDIRSFFAPVATKGKPGTVEPVQRTSGGPDAKPQEPAVAKKGAGAAAHVQAGQKRSGSTPGRSHGQEKNKAVKRGSVKSLAEEVAEPPLPASKRRKAIVLTDSEDDFEEPPTKAAKPAAARKAARKQDDDDDFEMEILNDDADSDGGSEVDKPPAARQPRNGPGAAAKEVPRPLAPPPRPAAGPGQAASDKTPPGSAPKAKGKGRAKTDTPRKPRGKNAAQPALQPDVQAAIDAVDAAAAKLPPEEEVNFTKMEAGAGGAFDQRGGDPAPQNPGSKEVPSGHPECLTGKTFVITGALESLHRHEMEDLIKKHSGRVTSSVSGKTSFLVAGEGSGTRKVATALEKKTKIIDEEGLFSLIRAAPAPAAQQAALAAAGPAPAAAAVDPVAMHGMARGGQASTSAPRGKSTGKAPSPTIDKPSGPARAHGEAASSGAHRDGQLWVERHKPQESSQLVGNPGHLETMRLWLGNW